MNGVPPSSTASATWNLLAGTTAKYVLLVVTIGIGVFLMPFTVKHLGKSEYGLWMLVASMTTYFQMLDLGYGNGLVRHLTEADAKGNEEGVNVILSTFVVVYSVIALVALAGTAALALFAVPRFPHLDAEQVRTARLVTLCLGFRMAIAFPMTVFGAVTTARQRFALTTTIAIVVTIVNAGVTYAVLITGHGLPTLVPASVGVALLSYVAYFAVALKVFPGMRITPSRFSRGKLREVTSFSLYVFLIDVSAQMGFNFDNVIIGGLLGTAAVAVYAVAARLADYQRQMCNQFNGLLFPVVVNFEAQGDTRALRSALTDGTRLALALVAGVTIPLVAFGPSLVRAWMGPGFEASIAPLYLLAIAGVVLVGQGPLGNILMATGQHRIVAFVSLGEAVANAVLSIIFVRFFGLAGAAAGTAVAVVAASVTILVPTACRRLGISLASLARTAALPALLGTLPAAMLAAILRTAWQPTTVSGVAAAGALVALVFFLAFWRAGLEPEDRARYIMHLRRLSGWFGHEGIATT